MSTLRVSSRAITSGKWSCTPRRAAIDLLPEIVPPEVDDGAYIYLSPINLAGNLSQAATPDGVFQSAYRSNIQFFNRNFFIVYSTGATRIYH